MYLEQVPDSVIQSQEFSKSFYTVTVEMLETLLLVWAAMLRK